MFHWIQWQKNCHYTKSAWTCHLLCKRPGCYHSTSKTHVRDRNFKMSSIHASVIYLIPRIRRIHWISILFREKSTITLLWIRNAIKNYQLRLTGEIWSLLLWNTQRKSYPQGRRTDFILVFSKFTSRFVGLMYKGRVNNTRAFSSRLLARTNQLYKFQVGHFYRLYIPVYER